MIDTKKLIRQAYFAALNGSLSYNGVNVPVSDDMLPAGSSATIYVILASQSMSKENTQQSWGGVEMIDLDIVYKAQTRASKEPLDDVAGQILAILFPSPGQTSLAPGAGIQINCPRLESDRYLTLSLNSSNSVERRILTFKQHVLQT